MIVLILTGHFPKDERWEVGDCFSRILNWLEFLSGNTGAWKEVEEIEQVETDEAKEQEKEQSVNACWGSYDNIHFELYVAVSEIIWLSHWNISTRWLDLWCKNIYSEPTKDQN